MMPALDSEAPRFTFRMRSIVSCSLMIAAMLVRTALGGEPGPMPALMSPPTSGATDAIEPPSEPWQPPVKLNPARAGSSELPSPEGAAAISDETKSLIIEEPSPWYSPIWLGPAPWDSGVELGLNGSSGTSDSLSVRTGAYIKRESRFS